MNPPSQSNTGALALSQALQGSKAKIWDAVWSCSVAARLAEHAYSQINFATGEVGPSFIDLDVPFQRSELVSKDPATVRDCSDRLLESRSDLDDVLSAKSINKQSRTQLRKLLEHGGVVSALMNTRSSVAVLKSFPLEDVWLALAHRIAKSVYSDESSDNPDMEWLLWNKLLFCRFFFACRLTAANQVVGQLEVLASGFHGPRSSLLAITERISAKGILDPPLPLVTSYLKGGIGLNGIHISDLLSAIQSEYGQMLQGQGIVHRIADPNRAASVPTELRSKLTSEQLITHRDNAYRQHEAAILAYGALSAIEQLLRSLASQLGVRHLKEDGTPRSAQSWLNKLGVSSSLLGRMQDLYSADGPNIRNRAMHAGLLETRSRGLEVILSARPSEESPTRSQDPYVAENLLQLLMRDLEELDAHVAAVGINTSDLAWAEELWLSEDDIEFGNKIHCEVLDPVESEAWQTQLFSFIDYSLPCLSTYARIAWLGWLEKFEPHNSLISFLAWGIVFEGLYRQTLHVIGFGVIQRSQVSGTNRMFQYRMLERGPDGLCSPTAMAAIVGVLRPHERENAEKTVKLAIKARNALSHGAITVHSEYGHFGVGHLFIKATQLFLAVTKEHMTREAAYYRFIEHPSDQSDPVENWLKAEDDIYAIFESPVAHLGV